MNQGQIKRWNEAATARALAHLRFGKEKVKMKHQIEQAWEQLDVAVDEVVRLNTLIQRMDAAGDVGQIDSFRRDLEIEQARARGKAEILAILMPAPLNTAEEISKESGRRWQAKAAGIAYQTRGIPHAAGTLANGIPPGQLLTPEEYAARWS